MLRDDYRRMNEILAPTADLASRTLERMEAPRKASPGKRRVLSMAVAVVLVVCLSLTAVAAAVPDFRQMLFGEETPFNWALTSQSSSGEKNGIRMEILGTMAQEDCLTVYYTLQDTEGLGRVTDQITPAVMLYINDEYVVNSTPAVQKQVLDYDPETQTAFCRTDWSNMQAYDGKRIFLDGDCQVRMHLIDISRLEQEWDYIPLDLSPVMDPEMALIDLEVSQVHLLDVYPEGLGSLTLGEFLAGESFFDEEGNPATLKPGEAVPITEMEDLSLTACGYMGGALHVQFRDGFPRPLDISDQRNRQYDLVATESGTGQDIAGKIADLTHASAPGMVWTDRTLDLDINRLRELYGMEQSFNLSSQGSPVFFDGDPDYRELTFHIAPEDFDQYEFFIRASEVATLQMNLELDFPLGESQFSDSAVFGAAEADGIQLGRIIVTPMCVTLESPVVTAAYNAQKEKNGFYSSSPLESITELEIICGNKSTIYYRAMDAITSGRSLDNPDSWEIDGWVEYANFFTDGSPITPSDITAIRCNGQDIPLTPIE